MSVNAMKPNFTNKQEYLSWMTTWRAVYAALSTRIRRRKIELKNLQREGSSEAPAAQRDLFLMRRDATKMMTLHKEAKARQARIIDMIKQIAEQPFPLEVKADKIEFHWNRVCLEFPFMPPWVIKAKGKQWFVHEMTSEVGFSVRNTPDKSTKGSVRLRKAIIRIDADGHAEILKA